MNTLDRFRKLRAHTSDDVSAAILTLAEVLAGDSDKFLTVKQAAAELKCSQDSIYQAVESGSLPATRVGAGRGTIRIRQSDLGTKEKPSRKVG